MPVPILVQDIGQMLRKLCEYKGIEIHEAEACKDHIHMLVSIPPKYSVSQIMGYLKGKSSLMIYEKYANLLFDLSVYDLSPVFRRKYDMIFTFPLRVC